MKKLFFVTVLAAVMVPLVSVYAQQRDMHHENMQMPTAMDEQKQEGASPDTQNPSLKAINAGNKICPVSGEKINEKTKATYEYNGKIYNFCCPMCIDEFKKDPEKYIEKVKEELNASKQFNNQENEQAEPGMEGAMSTHQANSH